jgi:hypothetical protein
MQKNVFHFLLIALLLVCSGAYAKPHAKTPVQLVQTVPNIKPILVTYDVYVGGVHFLTADALFQEENKKYHTIVRAHTYGFWHKMLPWDNMLDATGTISGDHLVPGDYHTRDVFKNKTKTSHLIFDGKGGVTAEYDPPSHDENRDIVTPEQRKGAFDPVTALLQMLASSAIQKNCAVTVPVFDGKRRFDISSTDSGIDTIDEEGYSVYKGPAHMCDATFNMVAGAWKEGERSGFWKLNEKEAGREPFHIWLATLSPDLPELPVRLESGSVWGLIIMHMIQWRYAGPEDFQ